MLDTPKSGYISMLISNERIKFFTVSGAKAKAADSGNVQQTTGYTLKLTQAGANYVNRALQARRPSSASASSARSTCGSSSRRRPPRSPASRRPGAGGGTPGQGDTPGGSRHRSTRASST